ncbi:MAG: hypothetical protein KDA32_01810 [Phycisphaerales bacterium]|nr:hypothetical protein [Phycisphaerales bacterium]
MSTATATDFWTDQFKMMTDNYNQTFKAGLKFQQDAAKFWTDMARKSGDEMRANWERAADEFMPFGKQNYERFQNMFNEQADKSLEMFRSMGEMKDNATFADMANKVTDVMRSSLETMRSSTEAVAKANTEMFNSFAEVMKKNGVKCCDTKAKAPAGK